MQIQEVTHNESGRGVATNNHAVLIAGGVPTGLMLAAELALAGIDVAVVERCANQELPGSLAGGQHARTIEVCDQRGVAERFLSQGQLMQVAGFSFIPLDISDYPSVDLSRLPDQSKSEIGPVRVRWTMELLRF